MKTNENTGGKSDGNTNHLAIHMGLDTCDDTWLWTDFEANKNDAFVCGVMFWWIFNERSNMLLTCQRKSPGPLCRGPEWMSWYRKAISIPFQFLLHAASRDISQRWHAGWDHSTESLISICLFPKKIPQTLNKMNSQRKRNGHSTRISLGVQDYYKIKSKSEDIKSINQSINQAHD